MGDGAVTVTAALALLPSLVAVMTAGPAATPVTTPAATVATPRALDDQVIVRPTSGVPPLSATVAVRATVCPTSTLALDGLTATEATGADRTAMVAVSAMSPLVAITYAVPAAMPVTRPATTLAVSVSLLRHDSCAFEIGNPL